MRGFGAFQNIPVRFSIYQLILISFFLQYWFTARGANAFHSKVLAQLVSSKVRIKTSDTNDTRTQAIFLKTGTGMDNKPHTRTRVLTHAHTLRVHWYYVLCAWKLDTMQVITHHVCDWLLHVKAVGRTFPWPLSNVHMMCYVNTYTHGLKLKKNESRHIRRQLKWSRRWRWFKGHKTRHLRSERPMTTFNITPMHNFLNQNLDKSIFDQPYCSFLFISILCFTAKVIGMCMMRMLQR